MVSLTSKAMANTAVFFAACTFVDNNSTTQDGGGVTLILPPDDPANMYSSDSDCPPTTYRRWTTTTVVAITNCTFIGNGAGVDASSGSRGYGGNGGALYLQGGGEVTINDTDFVGNTASGSGGGVYVGLTSIALLLHNCVFANNTAYSGDQLVMDSGGEMLWHNVTMALNLGRSQVRWRWEGRGQREGHCCTQLDAAQWGSAGRRGVPVV